MTISQMLKFLKPYDLETEIFIRDRRRKPDEVYRQVSYLEVLAIGSEIESHLARTIQTHI